MDNSRTVAWKAAQFRIASYPELGAFSSVYPEVINEQA